MGELRWPNLFLVGVAKAGTSSLADYLDQHPQIYFPPLKEPHFFSDARPRLDPAVKDEKSYLRLFENAAGQALLGDASVSYFWDADSAAAIKRVSPDAKIVIVLRDPIERTYSHYWHAYKNGVERRRFAAAVQDELAGRSPSGLEPYVGRSRYAEPLGRFLDTFPGNVHVLFFEELVADERAELRRLFAALGVAPEAAEGIDTRPRNVFALPRNRFARSALHSPRFRAVARVVVPSGLRSLLIRPLVREAEKEPMPDDAQRLLDGCFDADRVEIERLLGRRPPW